MKNLLKIIIYLMPLLICFSIFSFSGFCSALPDTNIILDQSELSVINGGLDNAKNYGLSSNGANLFTIPIWTTEVLNPYLYDNFGWDTDDVADFVLQPVEDTLTGQAFNGQYAWGVIDPIYDNVNTIASALENGFRFVETKLTQVGSLARVLGTNARAFVIGQVIPSLDEGPDKLADLSQNILVKLGNDFAQIWSSVNSDLEQNGDIYNTSTPNSVYYSSYFNITFNDDYYVSQAASLNFQEPIFYYGVNNLYFVFPTSMLYQNNQLRCNGAKSWRRFNTQTNEYDDYYQQFSLITLGGLTSIGTYNGIQYSTGYLYGDDITWNWFDSLTITNNFSSLQDIKDFLNNNNTLENASSVDYVDENGQPFDLQSLLDVLNGKYVTTDQLGQIKILIDDNPIVADSTGAKQIFTDDSIQDLIDKINEILNQQDDLADELGQTSDDPLPDPDPDPDPDVNNTGISVPPDYPTQTFDTVNDIIRSPLEFFSIFEPIFMIFGSSTLIIFSLWLFVPCVIIIAFIIWALK